MRLRHLRYFITVAEELNFTRASARLHIEPSPLSRAIKDLEDDLGVELLHRSKGRIRLTWSGEVFCKDARRLLALSSVARKAWGIARPVSLRSRTVPVVPTEPTLPVPPAFGRRSWRRCFADEMRR